MELSFLAKVRLPSFCASCPSADSSVHYQQLNIDAAEVEHLLVGLILDGKIKGRIDQINGRLELDKL